MTRRTFIKSVLAAWVAAQIDFGIVEKVTKAVGRKLRKKPKFDRTAEYGTAIELRNKNDTDLAIRLLKTDAARTLPKGTKYEILVRSQPDFLRNPAVAWYYSPRLQKARNALHGGYEVIGHFIA